MTQPEIDDFLAKIERYVVTKADIAMAAFVDLGASLTVVKQRHASARAELVTLLCEMSGRDVADALTTQGAALMGRSS
jgi:hypothetical protein